MHPKVSIIILTYNAPRYIMRTLKSLKETNYDNYEVIVFDNNSTDETKNLLRNLEEEGGFFDKLILSPKNLLWIKGNNEAFKYISNDSVYTLLLNSDIEIRNKGWLNEIVNIHKKGVTACYCCCEKDNRPDGWCYMIDTNLYRKFKLDEGFEVYYSSGALTANVINEGYEAQTIKNYENFIHHFGSASGAFKANSTDKELFESINWRKKCTLIDHIPMDKNLRVKLGKGFYIYNTFRKLITIIKKAKRKILKSRI